MIRRKVSAGLLRASKSNSSLRSTALAHAAPPLPTSAAQTQTAGLASATLLSSQRTWSKETIVTLKTELKKRGLSQTGNKATLIERLSSAESSAFLPPVPPLPSSKITAAPNTFNRKLSTSAPLSLPPKRSTGPTPKQPATPVSTEQVNSTGPNVVSQRTEAPKTAAVEPELVTVAPGLPQTKSTGSTTKETLDVKFPVPAAEEEIDQIIPVTPDNFRSAPSESSSSTSAASTPKVVTVASATTHPGGGPSHAIHEATDSHTLESAVEEIKTNIPALSTAVSSALAAPGKAWKSSELGKSILPEIGVPKSDGEGEEYKPSGKGLDGEEKRGLWVIGGIVGLGLLFGGGRSRREKREKKHAKEAAGGGAGGIKGDAEWEKASGAGVVGHGSRKDAA